MQPWDRHFYLVTIIRHLHLVTLTSSLSIHLNARRLDDLAVGCDVLGDEFAEFLRRRRLQHHALHAHAVLDLGDIDDAADGRVDLVDDGARRFARREDPEPRVDFVTGKPAFRDRRDVAEDAPRNAA